MNKTYKFELPQNKEVESTKVRIEDGKVFVDVEFKEKFQPKDGDFLVGSYGKVFIYSKKPAKDNSTYSAYCGEGRIGNLHDEFSYKWTNKKDCRFATPEEKSDFLERLEKECHKRWNAEKKCLEDIYIPKFGDIIKFVNRNTPFKRDYLICIYPDTNEPLSFYKRDFFNIANLDLDGNLSFHCANYFDSGTKVYPASESEKQELFEKLAEVGKRWNEKTKKLEDIRWKPFNNEDYWFINEDFIPIWDKFSNKNTNHIFRVKMNNCFKTKEAAQKVADQIKEIFKK